MARRETCNDKVLVETVAKTGEAESLVSEIVEWHSDFLAKIISTGAFEGVRVPGFGVFRAKLKNIQYRAFYSGSHVETTSRIINFDE